MRSHVEMIVHLVHRSRVAISRGDEDRRIDSSDRKVAHKSAYGNCPRFDPFDGNCRALNEKKIVIESWGEFDNLSVLIWVIQARVSLSFYLDHGSLDRLSTIHSGRISLNGLAPFLDQPLTTTAP